MEAGRSRAEWVRRYLSFIVILFVIAFGTSLSIRANLGSSPISAPPYILSLIPGMPLTMGQLTICMHVFFILIQILLLRKDFEPRQYAQILVSFLFGFYTDVTMWLTGFLQIPFDMNPMAGYPLRFVELLIGGAILAFGIACEVRCDSLMLAGEGLPLAISRFLKKDFGKVKICSDTVLVCIGIVFMFIYFGEWNWKMVGVGTLVSMVYVGFMVRVFSPHILWLDGIFIPRSSRMPETVAAAGDEWGGNPVITIARMYGSGGNEIGEAVAGRLGNWILRDNPHVLRVFIMSGLEYAVGQVCARTGMTPDEASRKIVQVNTGRANHYWHYTGRHWTGIEDYDLVINTSRTGIDGAVDIILRAVRDMK